jgi:four helix bundle protein
MKGTGFRELHVWRRSRDLAVLVYKVTGNSSYSRDIGLRDQMRRACVSVASNIAEGDERKTNKESLMVFYIAKGSLAELITQLELSRAVDYIRDDDFDKLLYECEMIGRMLGKLIKVRGSHHP